MKKFWVAGFFLPTINATVFSKIFSIFLFSFPDKKASLSQTLFTLRDHNIERRNSDPDLWGKHEDRYSDLKSKISFGNSEYFHLRYSNFGIYQIIKRNVNDISDLKSPISFQKSHILLTSTHRPSA